MNAARAVGLHCQTCYWEGVMHPMFVELFLKADPDELLSYETDKRRRARRAGRAQARTVVRATARERGKRRSG